MDRIRRALFALPVMFLLVLTGCATPQGPVPLDQAFWADQHERIGIAITEVPKPQALMAGQQGLLDVAINTAASATMRSKVETWDTSSRKDFPKEVAKTLSERGYQATVLEQPLKLNALKPVKGAKLGYSKLDYTSFKATHNVDKLVVFAVASTGTYRTYYGFIPTSAPITQVVVSAYVIDLDDNRLLYYQPFTTNRVVDGEWDEGPEFPNLTNTYYQALDQTQQNLMLPFKAQQISAAQP